MHLRSFFWVEHTLCNDSPINHTVFGHQDSLWLDWTRTTVSLHNHAHQYQGALCSTNPHLVKQPKYHALSCMISTITEWLNRADLTWTTLCQCLHWMQAMRHYKQKVKSFIITDTVYTGCGGSLQMDTLNFWRTPRACATSDRSANGFVAFASSSVDSLKLLWPGVSLKNWMRPISFHIFQVD